jgi:hypothetical protein
MLHEDGVNFGDVRTQARTGTKNAILSLRDLKVSRLLVLLPALMFSTGAIAALAVNQIVNTFEAFTQNVAQDERESEVRSSVT